MLQLLRFLSFVFFGSYLHFFYSFSPAVEVVEEIHVHLFVLERTQRCFNSLFGFANFIYICFLPYINIKKVLCKRFLRFRKSHLAFSGLAFGRSRHRKLASIHHLASEPIHVRLPRRLKFGALLKSEWLFFVKNWRGCEFLGIVSLASLRWHFYLRFIIIGLPEVALEESIIEFSLLELL